MNRMESRRKPLGWLGIIILLGTSLASCGTDLDQQFVLEHPHERHPVAGKVYLNGRPLSGAIVTFFAASSSDPPGMPVQYPSGDSTTPPHGRTGPDGTYEIDSPMPGLPVGEYRVTVSWNRPGGAGAGANQPPEQLPAKYQAPDTSGLKATVKPGDNLIPTFNLR